MTRYHSTPIKIKTVWPWIIIAACSLIAIYSAIISIVSVRIGLENIPSAGFWVPLIFGILFLILVLWIFVRTTRRCLQLTKDEDTFEIS